MGCSARWMCGCFTRDISRMVGALIDENYSANWVSEILGFRLSGSEG